MRLAQLLARPLTPSRSDNRGDASLRVRSQLNPPRTVGAPYGYLVHDPLQPYGGPMFRMDYLDAPEQTVL
jgi:hypothetical protein